MKKQAKRHPDRFEVTSSATSKLTRSGEQIAAVAA
jgi:hypothetical protein